jgi:F0F1-type ATP synthase membrane subunit b/b'
MSEERRERIKALLQCAKKLKLPLNSKVSLLKALMEEARIRWDVSIFTARDYAQTVIAKMAREEQEESDGRGESSPEATLEGVHPPGVTLPYSSRPQILEEKRKRKNE